MNNWYFIIDDTLNKKNYFLFKYLDKLSKGKLILLTPSYSPKNIFGYPQEYFDVKDNRRFNTIWAKLTFLFSKTVKSSSDIYFPKRNAYNSFQSHQPHLSQNRKKYDKNLLFLFLNIVINFFWHIKSIINNFLPNYENLFFRGVKSFDYKLNLLSKNIYIYDSLLVRHIKYASLIKFIRTKNVILYSVVSSWDNPFYSQFSVSAKKYFVWSNQMLNDLGSVHNFFLSKDRVELIGPYPFFNFYDSRKNHKVIGNQSKFIGYACAFCDVIFLQHEIKLIKKIAAIVNSLGYELLVRPYPTLPISEYEDLREIENVTLYLLKDEVYQDRFGDGDEFIIFPSAEERHDYLSMCALFISMGTSFTIEAAIDNIPILHIYLDKKFRNELFEKDLFERIEISDHIIKYFNRNLYLINSYEDLQSALEFFKNDETYAINLQIGNKKLLSSLGFNNM